MGTIVLKVITFFIFLICLGFVTYWAIAYIKGDCRLKVLKAKMSPLKVEKNGNEQCYFVLYFTYC